MNQAVIVSGVRTPVGRYMGGLKTVEAYDLAASGFGSADTLHLMTETMRRAYADRAHFIGDPDFTEMPISELISKSRGKTQRASINSEKLSRVISGSFIVPFG